MNLTVDDISALLARKLISGRLEVLAPWAVRWPESFHSNRSVREANVGTSFNFQGNFSASVATIREEVEILLGESVVPSDGFFLVPGSLSVMVSDADAEDTHVTMELYGFRENVEVSFTLSKSDPDAGNNHMWNVVLSLLATHGGAAVLLFNGDTVMLLRRDGKITLNQDWEWHTEPNWLPSRLPADVKMESIPVA